MNQHLAKRILAVMLGIAICLGMIPAGMLRVQAAEQTANLIRNGNFENGLDHWEIYFNEPNSGKAEVTQDFTARIHMDFFLNWWTENGDQGPVDWSTQLNQNAIAVEKGRSYKLRFRAKASVKRPAAVQLKCSAAVCPKECFMLGPEEQVYEMTVTPDQEKLDLSFFLGQFSGDQYPDFPYTTKEFEKHDIYICDVRLTDSAHADQKLPPSIVGVEDGASYQAPVSVRVNYKEGPYTLEVKKDGSQITYSEGSFLKEDGSYEITAADRSDASVSSRKQFTIRQELDFNREWVVIANKATGKVMEAGGTSAGCSLRQSEYAGRPGQFFLLEQTAGGVKLRCMAGNYVADIAADGSRLILAQDSTASSQCWQIDDTVPQGYVKFVNKASGMAADVPGASKTEGLQLIQAAKTANTDEGQQNNDAQRWDIIRTIDAKEAVLGTQTDCTSKEGWASHAVITPVSNGLNPAGPLTVEFYPFSGAASYDIYFDGIKTASVTQAQLDRASVKDPYVMTDDGTIKVFQAAYSTQVSEHSMYIQTDTGVKTNTVHFYLSKKGVGWGTLHRTEDMELSWYYRWSLEEALGTDEALEFVPMLWGNYGSDWLKDAASKAYGTVLSFNEPDWSEQSNVPVTRKLAQEWAQRYNRKYQTNIAPPASVEEAWQAFMDSGLRIGSPATALAPPYCDGSVTMNDVDGPDRWWFDFMDLMDSRPDWDYDFTAVHCYDAGCDAKSFLKMIDDTYALNQKPIWVTEFGVADWNSRQWGGANDEAERKVLAFMEEVVAGLEEREFVERYAWFPFDPKDIYGGASGIFDYHTGKLTELGRLYKSLGVPQGYDPDKKGQQPGDADNQPGDADNQPGDADNQPGNAGQQPGDADNQPGDSDQQHPSGQPGDSGTADMESLRQLLEAYLRYADSLKQNDYTDQSWSAAVQAIQEAKKKAAGSQAEVKKTLEALQNALALLERSGQTGRKVRVEQITLDRTSVTIGKGGKVILKAVILPADASERHIIWTSGNTKAADVNADGVVTGVAKGTAIITAITADGQKTAECKVTVEK